MDTPLVNKVAQSSLITINLEEFYPTSEVVNFDLKDFLFHGLLLKEKDFRQSMKEHDWSAYKNKIFCVSCSTDAIIPVWAFMLVSSMVGPLAEQVFVGSEEEYLKHHYYTILEQIDYNQYVDAKIVIKGCSNRPVPAAAYASLTTHLKPHVKSIMYGEPCSTVPIYKKPLKRIR